MDQNESTTFADEKTALDWIGKVECENGRQIRGKDIYPILNRWVNQAAPIEILDLGCGQGICSDQIDLSGRRYTGLEASPILVDRAKHLYTGNAGNTDDTGSTGTAGGGGNNGNRRFLVGNAYALPFAAREFDAVFTISVWHLLADLQKATEELSRVLKVGGHFMIITANPGGYAAWMSNYRDTKIEGKRFEGKIQLSDQSVSVDIFYFHSFDEIMAALQSTGLEVRAVETFRTSEESKGREYFISFQGVKRR